jgi:hypothetical protein
MTVDGYSEPRPETLAKIRRALRSLGIEITDYPSSPMNILVTELILSPKKYDTLGVANEILDKNLPEEEERYQARADHVLAQTGVVVLWAGGKLSELYVSRLRAAYQALGSPGIDGLTPEVVDVMARAAGLPRDPVQQALDQERMFPSVARAATGVFDRFVADRTIVYRPPDIALVQAGHLDLPPEWRPYEASRPTRSVRFPTPQRKYLMFLSIGHGGDDGSTYFTPVGSLMPVRIAEGLETRADAFLAMPLQCFPQQAVDVWRTVTVVSDDTRAESMQFREAVGDVEMLNWVRDKLFDAVVRWVDTLVQPLDAPSRTP